MKKIQDYRDGVVRGVKLRAILISVLLSAFFVVGCVNIYNYYANAVDGGAEILSADDANAEADVNVTDVDKIDGAGSDLDGDGKAGGDGDGTKVSGVDGDEVGPAQSGVEDARSGDGDAQSNDDNSITGVDKIDDIDADANVEDIDALDGGQVHDGEEVATVGERPKIQPRGGVITGSGTTNECEMCIRDSHKLL